MKVNKIKTGDKLAIVSLSNGIAGEDFVCHQRELGIIRLKKMGLMPVFMNNALKGIEYLRDNPQLRADDLKQAFADDSIKGIICAIGGDDTHLLTDYLLSDQEFINNVKTNPKLFLGFSDTTVNHLIFYKLGLNTFYGQAFLTEFGELEDEMLEYSKNNFLSLIEGNPDLTVTSSKEWYKERSDFSKKQLGIKRTQQVEKRGHELICGIDNCFGKLLGGCLESLYQLHIYEQTNDVKYRLFPELGEWNDKILFLETAEVETGTDPACYQLMIRYFKDVGIFDKINGLLVGKPQNELYYTQFKKILIEELSDYNIPIVYNLNFGHALPRAILPINIETAIDTNSRSITFKEDIFNN